MADLMEELKKLNGSDVKNGTQMSFIEFGIEASKNPLILRNLGRASELSQLPLGTSGSREDSRFAYVIDEIGMKSFSLGTYTDDSVKNPQLHSKDEALKLVPSSSKSSTPANNLKEWDSDNYPVLKSTSNKGGVESTHYLMKDSVAKRLSDPLSSGIQRSREGLKEAGEQDRSSVVSSSNSSVDSNGVKLLEMSNANEIDAKAKVIANARAAEKKEKETLGWGKLREIESNEKTERETLGWGKLREIESNELKKNSPNKSDEKTDQQPSAPTETRALDLPKLQQKGTPLGRVSI